MGRLSELTQALGLAAPIYNLGLAVIVICLFIKLFKSHELRKSRVYIQPWVLICVAFGVYVFEAVFTVLRKVGTLDVPVHVNGYFELVIISLFIYALLLQKQFVKKHKL